ncbi:MAG TPA: hypothetical protein VKW09_06640 [bacterium]|nr:hypothetical protein [bacterium]
MRTGIAAAAMLTTALAVIPAHAASAVTVPAGTKVLLRFETPVDSSTIKEGTTVKFTVATDVLVGRAIVFKQGAPAQGVVTDVSKPGSFGKNARVHISYVQADAIDGKPVRLAPLEVTPDSIKQVANVGAAGATALTGAILLGPIGLAAGALIHGGDVNLPAGAVGTSSVAEDFQAGEP